MVNLSNCLKFAKEYKRVRSYLKSKFIDTLRIYVKAGSGGSGLPKYGGIGGKGGDVYVVAKEGVTLRSLKDINNQRYVADSGEGSSKKSIVGAPGNDVIIKVPAGVVIMADDGRKLGELNEEGTKCLVARGGYGGTPFSQFSGSQGEALSITLDLKLIADVGLVGFPNAGKSTLLKAISNAKPKVAEYPFTTIRPNLGIIKYKDFHKISVADLPGLIEGAHINVGMGHRFLKHVERTKLLMLVVDIKGFQLSPKHVGRNCLETVALLNKELELYKEDLLSKPSMIVVNKMDLEGAKDEFKEVHEKLKHWPETVTQFPEEMQPSVPLQFERIIPISAKESSEDINKVKIAVKQLLDYHFQLEVNSVDNEIELLHKLRRQVTEHGPRLV